MATKIQLAALADEHGIQVGGSGTKADIEAALHAAGIDPALAEPEPEPEPDAGPPIDRLDRVEHALTLLLRGETSAAVSYFLGEAGR
jgi:hypothetical protein